MAATSRLAVCRRRCAARASPVVCAVNAGGQPPSRLLRRPGHGPTETTGVAAISTGAGPRRGCTAAGHQAGPRQEGRRQAHPDAHHVRQRGDREHAVTGPQVEDLTHDRSGREQAAVGQLHSLGPAAGPAGERQHPDNTAIVNTVIVNSLSAGGGGRGRDVSVIGQWARPDRGTGARRRGRHQPRTVRRGGPCRRFKRSACHSGVRSGKDILRGRIENAY